MRIQRITDLSAPDGLVVPALLVSPEAPNSGAVLLHPYGCSKEHMLGLAFALAGAATTGLSARSAARGRPNILLIVTDDLGWGDLGCTGNRTVRSPNIDRLASDGVRFTNFYVSWPACTPSRSTILTGRYPQRNGLYDMIRNNEVNWKFQFDEASYAKVLK